jgi:hypothetical protein
MGVDSYDNPVMKMLLSAPRLDISQESLFRNDDDDDDDNDDDDNDDYFADASPQHA